MSIGFGRTRCYSKFSFFRQNKDLKIFFGHVFSINHDRVLKSMYLAFLKFFTTCPKNEKSPGCARFPEFVQNFSEHQILWSLCSVDFHTLILQLPIQTPHSVAPELQVFMSSLENCQNFSKTSTPPCHLVHPWLRIVAD